MTTLAYNLMTTQRTKTYEIHFHHAPYITGKGYSIIYIQDPDRNRALDKAWEDLYRFYTDLEDEPRPEVTLVKEVSK